MKSLVKDDAPLWQQIAKVAGCILVLAFFYGFGFHAQECRTLDLTKGVEGVGVWDYSVNLYCLIHPMYWHDILGIILFTIAVIGITGVYSWVLGQFNVTKGEMGWLTWGLVAFGALGIILFAI